jgi:subtilisin family serine protease
MSEQTNPANSPATGVPQASQGMILQRGGEELILEKVSDRFTVRLATPINPNQLAPTLSVAWRRTIPKANLEVFTVEPRRLDAAMAQARASDSVAFASHAYQIKDRPGSVVYLTDQITIQFATDVDAAKIAAIAAEFGLQQVKPVVGIPNTFVFEVSQQAADNPVKIANKLMGKAEVLTAEPNIVVRQEPHYRPRDPMYPQQWYLGHNGGSDLAAGSHISVERAWDITRGVRSIVVAIADDSFDLNHPDFQGAGKVVAPRDLKEKDMLPLPDGSEPSHGTACAGVAVAEENGTGIVGVAPGCALMPIRTTGFLDDDSVEELFDWALSKGAAVISCSWGAANVYFPLSLRQRAAITRAATEGRKGKGCVILFAAGNANRPIQGTVNERNWPNNILSGSTEWLSGFAVHPDVITVSAATSLSKKAIYSNWGTNISVCAPSNNAPPGMWFQQSGYIYTAPAIASNFSGRGVFSTDILGAAGYDKGDFTSTFGGTSSATPVVAGVAALVLSANPDLTAAQVKRILQDTADKIVDADPDPQLKMRLGTYDSNGHSQWFGYGKVNAFKAVQAAVQMRAASASVSRQLVGRNNAKLAIPDNNPQGVKSAISVSDSSPVTSIQVTVNITHDFLGDLEIYLIPPNNQQVLLQNRTLGRRTQLQATYTPANTPSLQNILKQPARGIWQLWVVDEAAFDVGTLNSWELSIGL